MWIWSLFEKDQDGTCRMLYTHICLESVFDSSLCRVILLESAAVFCWLSIKLPGNKKLTAIHCCSWGSMLHVCLSKGEREISIWPMWPEETPWASTRSRQRFRKCNISAPCTTNTGSVSNNRSFNISESQFQFTYRIHIIIKHIIVVKY